MGTSTAKKLSDLFHGGNAHIIGGGSVEGDIIEGGGVFIVIFGVVKFGTGDAVHSLYGFFQIFSFLIGNVGYHDSGRTVGDKLLVHDGKSLTGFRFLREIGGDVIFHIDPAGGENTED